MEKKTKACDIIDEITAYMENIENPMAIDNLDGTSDIVSDGITQLENIPNDSLEQYLEYSDYGNDRKHDQMRYNRRMTTRDNKLIIE